MMLRRFIVLAFVGLAAPAGADPYYPAGDIAWPTYLLVTKSYDATLSCGQLQSEIAKVDGDIHLLHVAQNRVEDALRTAYDTQGATGRDVGGAMLNTAVTKAGLIYSQGRDQIRESARLASLRREHLQNLAARCPSPR
ncbi:MAG: hypothetical protein P4L57_05845 [Rhizomicrobium sp.]|nr:hypothetical protein [Rhizomicrobium sp.]